MLWIGKHPPIYVWNEDKWLCERDMRVYVPDYCDDCWITEDGKPVIVPFQKKTVKMDRRDGKTKIGAR
jgi:hypothetical protein